MTESEWLASDDPRAMLRWLTDGQIWHSATHASPPPRPSDRKLRLFACACAWQPWQHPLKAGERGVVLAAERMADDPEGRLDDPEGVVPHADRMGLAVLIQSDGGNAARRWCEFQGLEPWFVSRQAAVLRDLVGNPFRPVRWSSCDHCHGTGWRTKIDRDNPGGSVSRPCRKCGPNPTVLSLATAAYERRSPDATLDPVRLAVLSDALEEAGCPTETQRDGPPGPKWLCTECESRCELKNTYVQGNLRQSYACPRHGWRSEAGVKGTRTIREPHPLLAHLRGREWCPHYRGCWVVDLILGRE